MSNGLYTRDEISRMTNDALDELLSHYACTGNTEGAGRVQDEIDGRADDYLMADEDQQMEMAHEAEQERQQIMHDEMINDAMAQDGRWG